MDTRRSSPVPCICVLAASCAYGQISQIFQAQGAGQDKVLQVKIKTGGKDKWFTTPTAPGSSLCNYHVYQIDFPDDPRMKIEEVSSTYLDYPQDCGAVTVQLPGANASEQQIQLPLKVPLKYGVRYLLTVRDPSDSNADTNTVVGVFTGAGSLLLEPQPGKTAEVMVTSTVWLKASKGDAVTFKNKSATQGQPDTELHGKVERVTARGMIVTVTDKFQAGRTGALQLTSQGLVDGYGTDIHAAGKVTPATENTSSGSGGGLPSINSAMLTTQLSATAAVHSNPAFSANGALAPWNQAIHMIDISRGKAVYFDPVVNFDVGTTNSKSNNSVILPSPISHAFTLTGNQQAVLDERNDCLTSSSKDCNDSQAAMNKSARYSSLNTSFGPREEFDTLYGGTNLIGEVRFDLYPSFWYHTPASKKAQLAAGNPAIRDLLQMPEGGWSIAPYLQYDGGGHVTAQTIINSGKNPAAIIPTYGISRLYLGMVFAGTYKTSSVNFDGAWFDLFAQETVPTIVSKVTYAKNYSSWQPHFKGTYSLSLDPARHFLLSVSWENGRSAPSFGYLNKATAGLQVVY